MGHGPLEERIDEYWTWIAGALFLLVTVDLLTTVYAASVRGVAGEANPVTAELLERGILELVLANLVATVLLVVLFYGVVRLVREADPPFDRMLALFLEVWLGVLVGVGLAVFANNLAVIFYGRSLL